ncbi:MAG: hypothetical protein ACTSQE_02305 [Candidatus Heimdallarchaeaceae archaeon]
MVKLRCSDDVFLKDIAALIENGKNLEQAIFSISYIPQEVLYSLQLGNNVIEALSIIEFEYPIIINLFSSLSLSNINENLKRIRTIANLIKRRNEILEEKNTLLRIHGRRMSIIRYITMLTIAIIAGISPLFTGIYSFLITGKIIYSFSLLTPFSISFLFINILNNYFLLKVSREKNIKVKILIVSLVHIVLVVLIRIFLMHYAIVSENSSFL